MNSVPNSRAARRCQQSSVPSSTQKIVRPVVHNLIRGSDRQPGAWTTFGGATVKRYGSRVVDGSGASAPSRPWPPNVPPTPV